ncbi:LOW QUALITY PROTEIN: hypothetical protein V2J09_009197 [Rumex salicifolius]
MLNNYTFSFFIRAALDQSYLSICCTINAQAIDLGGSRMMSCRMDWCTCMSYGTLWVMHVFGESFNGYENCCDMEHHDPRVCLNGILQGGSRVFHFNVACWDLAKPYYTYWKSHIMCISWCIGTREMATVVYDEMQDKNVYAFTSCYLDYQIMAST